MAMRCVAVYRRGLDLFSLWPTPRYPGEISKVKSAGSHPANWGGGCAPQGAEPPSSQSLEGKADTGFVIAIITNYDVPHVGVLRTALLQLVIFEGI